MDIVVHMNVTWEARSEDVLAGKNPDMLPVAELGGTGMSRGLWELTTLYLCLDDDTPCIPHLSTIIMFEHECS